MPHNAVMSIDIGSTWTKGAIIDIGPVPSVKSSARVATSDNLLDTCEKLSGKLLKTDGPIRIDQLADQLKIVFCSSAKGGLGIAAIGLVPELTLHIARLCALSAGGKVIASYSHQLATSEAEGIAELVPDIVLLTGGTDGGNDRCVIANARAIADASITSTVVFAGNAKCSSEVTRIFDKAGIECVAVENVMPDIGEVNIEPARKAIREVFMKRIVTGKGLDALVTATQWQPDPTPLAVLRLVEAIASQHSSWSDTCLVDLGGATTDFYSVCEPATLHAGTILRGIPEPAIKRTVEGDLGMRISSSGVIEQARKSSHAYAMNMSWGEVEQLVALLETQPAFVPTDSSGIALDSLLARICVSEALIRHAGTMREIFTPDGKRWVQRGKDLRRISRVIGTGGYLSRMIDPDIYAGLLGPRSCPQGRGMLLLPEKIECYRDKNYLFTVLGNIAAIAPSTAATLAIDNLEKL